jgi:hypothetical protein
LNLTVGLRRDLAEAVAGPPTEAGGKLRLLLSEEHSRAEEYETTDRAEALEERYSPARALLTAREEAETRRSVGRDGVLVLTGEAWDEALMSLGPEQRPSMLENR